MPKCPISCGECCDQWANIEVLWHNNRHLDMDDLCPNLGSDGCRLPRSHRPRICREYLCSRARQVLALQDQTTPPEEGSDLDRSPQENEDPATEQFTS